MYRTWHHLCFLLTLLASFGAKRISSAEIRGVHTAGYKVAREIRPRRPVAFPQSKNGQRELLLMRGGGCHSRKSSSRVSAFLDKNFFIVAMASVVALAWAMPWIGVRNGPMKPEILIDRGATNTLFILSGLALPLRDLGKAVGAIRLNLMVQGFSLGAMPLLMAGLVGLLRRYFPLLLHGDTLDGLVVMACMPTTVNMCVVLTGTANGNVAGAVFNAVLGNLLGVVVTPLWLLHFLKGRGILSSSVLSASSVAASGTLSAPPTISAASILKKISVKVMLPLGIGIAAGSMFPALRQFRARWKKKFARASELLLLSIIFTTFCDTFVTGSINGTAEKGYSQIGILLVLLPAIHLFSMALVFFLAAPSLSPLPGLGLLPRREDQATAMICATQKTVALGIPLLKALIPDAPSLSRLSAPLLLYHPLQLLIDSTLTSAMKQYISGVPIEENETQ